MGRHRVTSRRRIIALAAGGVMVGALAGWAAPSFAGGACATSDIVCHFTYTNGLIQANGRKLDAITALLSPPSPSPTNEPTTSSPTRTPPPTTDSPSPSPSPSPTMSESPTELPSPTTSSPTGPGGWPDASSTGVLPGSTLTTGKCPGTISRAGTVIENQTIANCSINITASNVTLRNDRLLNTQIAVNNDSGKTTGVLLTHLTIDGQNTRTGSDNSNDVAVGGGYGGGYELAYSNIQGWDTGATVNSAPANAYIHDNYVHDLGGNGSSTHKTAMSSNGGGGNARIIHNNLDCNTSGCSAAFSLYGDFATISGWDVENNLFNTEGSYCTYEGTLTGKKFPTAKGITWTGNVYGRAHNKQCGQYGPADGWGGTGNIWSGNTWADTGAIVPAG